jgi:hypothetical protein
MPSVLLIVGGAEPSTRSRRNSGLVAAIIEMVRAGVSLRGQAADLRVMMIPEGST